MIELSKVEDWQRIVDVISSFISEGNFRFTSKGIAFRAVDQSQIVMVNFTIDKSVFDVYDIEPNFVGIDLKELARIVARAQPNDRMILDLTDSEMHLSFEGDLNRSFKLPLLDLPDTELKLPEYKFDATVEISGRLLKESLKDAALFGSSVTLKIENGIFFIEAKGTSGKVSSSSKKSAKVEVDSKKDVVSKYSLNYLMNITKGADPEGKVFLELKSDTPMRMKYSIGSSEMEFLIAYMML